MLRSLVLISLIFVSACSKPEITASIDMDNPGALVSDVRIEIYLTETTSHHDCNNILELTTPKDDMNPSLVFDSWAAFETQGIATIQIDHLPADKKMLILVLAVDPTTEAIIASACKNNIEVEKGATRDVHLILRSTSELGDNE